MVAADRLAVATDLLAWVRGESPRPMGIPELAGSIEHLEGAAQALRAARECLLEYLVALGFSASAEATAPEFAARPVPLSGQRATGRSAPAKVPPLRRWWSQRVDELIDSPEPIEAEIARENPKNWAKKGTSAQGVAAKATARTATEAAAKAGGEAAGLTRISPDTAKSVKAPKRTDHRELLRQVSIGVRDNDREALRSELRDVDPPVGLALSAICPAELRELTHTWLGRHPTPDDLPRLREISERRMRDLLPGLPHAVLSALLLHLCRVPSDRVRSDGTRPGDARKKAPPVATTSFATTRVTAEKTRGPDQPPPPPPAHPTDSALASAVLVGILADHLKRDPSSLGHRAEHPDE